MSETDDVAGLDRKLRNEELFTSVEKPTKCTFSLIFTSAAAEVKICEKVHLVGFSTLVNKYRTIHGMNNIKMCNDEFQF
jgi:hypothetical protein